MRLIAKWIYKIAKWYCYVMLLLATFFSIWYLYLLEIVNVQGVERSNYISSVHGSGWAFVAFLILSIFFTYAPTVFNNRTRILSWLKNN